MTVTHEIDGKVGVVTLAKPPHNLLDDQLINDLIAAYRAVIAGGCRAILLRSSMRHFCAGAEMASWGTGTIIHTDQAKFEAMMRDLEDAPVPTVAAINGGALGGGLEIALTLRHDHRCRHLVPRSSRGRGSASYLCLAARSGFRSAPAWHGRRKSQCSADGTRLRHLSAGGIINQVVPESELASASMTWARQLAAGPTQVIKGIKMQANLEARGGIASADARQVEINDMIWKAKDRQRGADAFFATGPCDRRISGRLIMSTAPLEGLRVVDFTRVLAGPPLHKGSPRSRCRRDQDRASGRRPRPLRIALCQRHRPVLCSAERRQEKPQYRSQL